MYRDESTTVRPRVIQGDAYAESGKPDFTFQVPQPFEASHFSDLREELGIDPAGFANQSNQVLAENLANNMASRIKKAVKDKTALPTQEDMDNLYDSYDFTGVRAGGTAFASLFERIFFRLAGQSIRKLLKTSGYQDMPAPVSVAKKSADTTGPNEIDYETFETEVRKLMDAEGPWGETPAYVDHREALVEAAKAEEERVRASQAATEEKLSGLQLGG